MGLLLGLAKEPIENFLETQVFNLLHLYQLKLEVVLRIANTVHNLHILMWILKKKN